MPYRRIRLLHFQLQVTIGSYGYTNEELCLVHGVLLLLAAVVVRWILLQVSMLFACGLCFGRLQNHP